MSQRKLAVKLGIKIAQMGRLESSGPTKEETVFRIQFICGLPIESFAIRITTDEKKKAKSKATQLRADDRIFGCFTKPYGDKTYGPMDSFHSTLIRQAGAIDLSTLKSWAVSSKMVYFALANTSKNREIINAVTDRQLPSREFALKHYFDDCYGCTFATTSGLPLKATLDHIHDHMLTEFLSPSRPDKGLFPPYGRLMRSILEQIKNQYPGGVIPEDAKADNRPYDYYS